MFILTTVEDVVAIEPDDFTKPSIEALEDNVNEKYANKVLPGAGLCLCFYDLLKASDGLIGHGKGAVNVKAEFRLVVFRPFRSEILEGTIESATSTGMTVSLGFFEDIFIPGPANLFKDSHFDSKEKVWIWKTDDAELYFDRGERVRFRVEEEIWTDLAPGDEPPKLAQNADVAPPGPRVTQVNDEKGKMQGRVHQEILSDEQKKNMRSYRLIGSMQQGGLGLLSWWQD